MYILLLLGSWLNKISQLQAASLSFIIHLFLQSFKVMFTTSLCSTKLYKVSAFLCLLKLKLHFECSTSYVNFITIKSLAEFSHIQPTVYQSRLSCHLFPCVLPCVPVPAILWKHSLFCSGRIIFIIECIREVIVQNFSCKANFLDAHSGILCNR